MEYIVASHMQPPSISDAVSDAPDKRVGFDTVKSALADIRQAWETFALHPESERLERLQKSVSDLSSLSSGQGIADVSAVALAMELKLASITPYIRGGEQPDADQMHSLRGLMGSLEHTVASLGHAAAFITKPISKIGPRPAPQRAAEVAVACADADLCAWLVRQLEGFGYSGRIQRDLGPDADLSGTAAIIVEVGQLPGSTAELPHALRERAGRPTPLFFVVGEDDLQQRLIAAKSGSDAYFALPVDVAALIDKLDSIHSGVMAEPYRILIVDDDPTLSKVYEMVFQDMGWVTYLVNDPMNIMRPLAEFSPDIVLMDLYMPGVSGTDLAAVIRQDEKYVAIPIVYLSMEEDVAKQVSAISHGADDFLSKTMRPDHLVAAIESRVQRYRVLRSLLSRDGLTGLLNHANLKIQLENELTRAARLGTRLALAMIDLDRFKSVNDTYGHLVGDQVLKTLSTLLRKRLRTSDIIGRYGGEEFGVILLDIGDPASAARLLDSIRQAFAEMLHESELGSFQVTFSCGLATFPEFPDMAALTDAADKALYEAKRSGRNQVVLGSADEDFSSVS